MKTAPKILVIDDEPDVLTATSHLLKKAGYEVLEARNGDEGIEAALREVPDLVILDVVLGDEDGVEICRRIKAESTLWSTYVVLVSGKRLSTDEVVAGLDAGAEEYFRRPFRGEEFVARLRTLFRLQQTEAQLRASEEHFRTTLASIGDAVVSTDTEGLVTGVNAVAENLTGWSEEEAVGEPLVEVFRIVNEETLETVENPVARALREGGVVGLANHTLLLSKDGREIPIADSAAPITSVNGQITGVVLVFRDQSEERAAEKALRESEARLRAILDATPFPVAVVDSEGNQIEYWSHGAETLFGHTAPTASQWYEMAYPDPAYREDVIRRWKLALTTARETGRSVNAGEYEVTCADASVRICELHAAFVQNNLVVTFNDLTRRKAAENALRSQYRLLCVASETVRFGGWSVDVATGRITWSDVVAEIHGMEPGYSPRLDEGIGFYAPEWRERIKRVFTRCAEEGTPYDEELEIINRSGDRLWVRTVGQAVRDENGAVVCVEGSFQDVTERKQVEDDLRRRRAYLERIFEVLPIGLWFVDKDGTLLRGNPAGIGIWGAEPHVPISEYGIFKAWRLPSREPVQPEDWALAKTIREGVTVVDEVLEIEAFDGKRKKILNYTAPILDEQGDIEGAIVINLDISDRAALESQLAQAQKLESVGRLAGGIAHDFNNLLMGIMNYVELCRDGVEPDHPIREWLDEVTHDAERSAALVRQLLAFARKQTIAPEVLDLHDSVSATLKMLQRLIGEDINLLWQPAAALPPVEMDPAQLDQILANLCVNARDAIHGVGKITIETMAASIDSEYCAEHAEAIPGDFAVLGVSDDGCGMDRETLANVFEPFFTTKGVGEGTGLGLSTVYGIVKQNGGFINVYSEPGQGTTFRIYLPRSEQESAATATSVDEAPRIGGDETVLLVEDEKSVRVTTRMFLQDLGYTVLAAEDPEQALRLAEVHDAEIHLLITDVVMPGMDGRELAAKLAEAYPKMRCLFMSGYTANVIAHRGILEENVHFLSKPFTRDELARKVREVLE